MNIEFHLIQSFAPSCLNRDDTNTPKSCLFGGVRRARVSSQCLKRAIRVHMKETQGLPSGVRTRRLAESLAKTLSSHGRDADEALRISQAALRAAGFTFDTTQPTRTTVGLYLAPDEVERLAAAIDKDWTSIADPQGDASAGARREQRRAARATVTPAVDEAVKAIRDRVTAVDIALFGRMVAENAHMNVDAACQVAHAVSTHAAEVEMDFFTAVDDLRQPDEEPGAGMMGIVEFNSACFYRYALINLGQLIENLSGDKPTANRAILGFARAALEAIPTGRQNSSAAQNRVDYLQVYAGDGPPTSLANAFENPVRSGASGSLTEQSVYGLRAYQERLTKMYGARPGEERCSTTVELEDAVPVPDLLNWLEGRLQEAA